MSSDVREMVNEQKRRRRLTFWGGFLAIAIVGSLWAGLSKDPRGPGFFGDEGFNDAVVDQPDFIDEPPPPLMTTGTFPRGDELETTVPETTAPVAPEVETTAPGVPESETTVEVTE